MHEFDMNMIKLMQSTLDVLDYELYLNDRKVHSDELSLKEIKNYMQVYKEERDSLMNEWEERLMKNESN